MIHNFILYNDVLTKLLWPIIIMIFPLHLFWFYSWVKQQQKLGKLDIAKSKIVHYYHNINIKHHYLTGDLINSSQQVFRKTKNKIQ